jgi:hypothetical protein
MITLRRSQERSSSITWATTGMPGCRSFGAVRLNGTSLTAGDGAAMSQEPVLQIHATEAAELLLLRYSAPMWVPFSATERRMSRTRNTNRTDSAADAKKTSKYASDNAC